MESLGKKLDFFLEFIESYTSPGGRREVVEDLESQIASAAHAAEDVIESFIVDQILSGSTKESSISMVDVKDAAESRSTKESSVSIVDVMDATEFRYTGESSVSIVDAKGAAESGSTGESSVPIVDVKDSAEFGSTKESSVSISIFDVKDAAESGSSKESAVSIVDVQDAAESEYAKESSVSIVDVKDAAESRAHAKSSCSFLLMSVQKQIKSMKNKVMKVQRKKQSQVHKVILDAKSSCSFLLMSVQKQTKAMKKKVMKVQRKKHMKKKVIKIQREKQSQVDKVILAAKFPSFLLDLQKIIEEMHSIMEKVIEVKKEGGFKDPMHAEVEKEGGFKDPMQAALSKPLMSGKTTMVGFDTYFNQLLDWLTGQQSCQEIISITGMGGIGKTTLAKSVYGTRLIVQHFDVRAWVVVSPEYSVREILGQVLSCLGQSIGELGEITEEELGGQLHKILFGRRYLIILDDMWGTKAWNKIIFFFPENGNGSRVVVTTRQSNVAKHFCSLTLALNFLNDDESWSLFCEKAFAQEDCPPYLEKIGKKIVKKCKGLPLSIVVMGGLIGKSSRAQEYWENVASDISSFQNLEVSNQCLDILSLSYSHLPACLKPCFLHLGTFPEDHEIRVSLLVKLWVAEGFLKPNEGQSLEEVAEDYIRDLIGRNLVLVSTLRLNGRIKTCKIHDLLRDLCLRIADKDKFFHVTRSLDSPGAIDRQRRIIIHGSNEEYHTPVLHTLELASLTRSLICNKRAKLTLRSKLLRVLLGVDTDSVDDTFRQVNLRFLAYQYENIANGYALPSSICLLWNAQTIIITKGTSIVDAPIEIWEMRQLRHIKFNLIRLPDPPVSENQDDVAFLNLQTLETASNFRCSKDICKRLPNIKKLRIVYDNTCSWSHGTLEYFDLHNVGHLNKLESLKCSFLYPNRDNFLRSLSFPTLLKKLTLENCELQWSDLTQAGSLHHLEVLKLYNIVNNGPEWSPVEGEFLSLKFLGIYGSDLICWNADNSHFPVLVKLVLDRLWRLDEIPLDIGEIPTLDHICVYDCNISTAISAVKILEDQENMGNQDLQVEVVFSGKRDLEKFKKKMELEGFSTHNLQIDSM